MSKIDIAEMNSFYFESIRRFDTICTLCAGLTSKIEEIKKDFPGAIVDIQTVASVLYRILEECREPLESFDELKKMKNDTLEELKK